MSKELGFDYEVLATCEYPMPCLPHGESGGNCGKPATHRVWWTEDGADDWDVCPEHFEFIKKQEAEEEEPDEPK